MINKLSETEWETLTRERDEFVHQLVLLSQIPCREPVMDLEAAGERFWRDTRNHLRPQFEPSLWVEIGRRLTADAIDQVVAVAGPEETVVSLCMVKSSLMLYMMLPDVLGVDETDLRLMEAWIWCQAKSLGKTYRRG